MPSITCRCCGDPSPGHLTLGRRAFISGVTTAGVLAAVGLPPGRAGAADPVPKTDLTPDQALRLLQDGNDQFRMEEPFRAAAYGRERRVELARGQAPFSVLVGCSDSRVSPELLFGRGLGELFIVRNAGNTIDTAALGSVEYGVGVLGCPLVVVLGHESCGAVAAAVEVVQKDATFPGVIGEMIQPIIPAVLAARRQSGEVILDDAVVANAKRVAARVKTQSPVIQGLLRQGKLKMTARYGLASGHVEWFEDV
jgi:carbonic anhydrase